MPHTRSVFFFYSQISLFVGNLDTNSFLGVASDLVMVVVLSASQGPSFRRAFPQELFFILPESGRSIGYKRHMVKQVGRVISFCFFFFVFMNQFQNFANFPNFRW